MIKKTIAFLIILSSVLIWFFIIKNYPCLKLSLWKKGVYPNCAVITVDPGPRVEKSRCAKAGEEPVSNFDFTTGKTDPSIEIIPCCEGLQSIEQKQKNEAPIIVDGGRVCGMVEGGPNQICSPCGNGVCDAEYEDYCNCKEDCK